MLQLSTVEMEERVHAEVLENPALEECEAEPAAAPVSESEGEDAPEESSSSDDYRSEDDIPDYNLWDYRQNRQERAEEIPFSDDTSFYEKLKEQIGEQQLTEHQQQLCEYLIGSLEDDGLLHKELAAVADELAIYYGIETDARELEEMLRVIQSFEPAGVGARNLQECLLLQLERKNSSPVVEVEKTILTKYFEDFGRKRWDRIQQKMETDKRLFDEAMGEITRLNPRPGIALGEGVERSRQQIVPDFLVETQGDQINMSLNRGFVPELRVSGDYMQMLQEQIKSPSAENREAALFLKGKIDAAKNFIEAMKQRESTLTATMQAIIRFQRPFFIEGDESLLKPMILKDIAGITHYDISTVSRVSNSKYVQTNWGIYPLKFFFSDRVTNSEGEEVSVREVHQLIKDFVKAEEKENPLTDDQLMQLLQEKGFATARRTVAKYREQLHIPVARLRKN